MAGDPAPDAGPATLDALATKLGEDLLTLDSELGEVDLLITQAKAEAARHEGKRSATADKLAELGDGGDPAARLELTTALVTLTKRAALMETQVEVLEGKRRPLARYRDAVAAYLETVRTLTGTGDADAGSGGAIDEGAAFAVERASPAVARLVLGAQEDLRREIARAMHDGPAQSLTNIVLQAQIVERLVTKDPAMAAGEVRQLTAMVQQTLDATKSFIFDVRPMVLDDLGLVPTLRRATRERASRTGIPVDFESLGNDRRLPPDLESGLFRMLDDALAAYVAEAPDNVSLRLDWSEQLEARVSASRAVVEPVRDADAPDVPEPEASADLPPALAAMVEDRREHEREAAEAAIRRSIVALPEPVWAEIQARAASVGVTAERLGDGGELRLVADLPPIHGVQPVEDDAEPAAT